MCGSVAFLQLNARKRESVDLGHDKHILQKQLEVGLDAVQHRGPDGREIWLETNNRVSEIADPLIILTQL